MYRVFQARVPVVEVRDADAVRQIAIKDFNKFYNRRALLENDPSPVISYFLTVINDDHWKHVRNMLTPTFTSGKLKQACMRGVTVAYYGTLY